ncbi:MAG TPA: BON domain-containing protein [Thermoflexales bacterium]|jgi:osmotically-inducible protein OsmY|nr:BON domain-containing protein [Anaerolineae bacterium]HQV29283.1 BON domain-containing protein [Thermoflexales bacterium]HQX09972.1 BON domain-containing protein [Thermoflexales bacterium]HQY23720.1 BON domain-containing protein [Thermoflexales bacterium]HQZ52617.1 BON domain-containing protein [Thermoflexales bacterium]
MRSKSDATLHGDVLAALQFEPSLNETRIAINVRKGVVTLLGKVDSYADKATAERVVRRVDGVRGIANDLEVEVPEHHVRTDTDVAQSALDALRWDVTVPAQALQVKVEKGWLTLSGEVEWHFQKRHAEDAVRRLRGLRGVINLITVKARLTAVDIKRKIEGAFERNARIHAGGIRVEVDGSRVTLTGMAATLGEMREAEAAAWAAAGVTEVVNTIQVSEAQPA